MIRLTNKECSKYEDFVFSLRNKLTTSSEINDSIYKKLKSLDNLEEELGIDFIGCELNEEYFNEAIERLKE